MAGYAAPKISTVRVGIIGLGNRGPSHMNLFRRIEGVEIKALCDLRPERVKAVAKQLEKSGHTPVLYAGSEDEWKKLCERQDLDLVVVTTPYYLHAPMAIYAMNQGKHRTDTRIGVYAAWNRVARMAQGDYLISCSTNDRLRQDACEILARTLDENPDVALVYGNSFMTKIPHQTFDPATLCSLYIWPEYAYETLLERCMVGPHPMWRRKLHERYGFFDESYVALGDQEFWLRLGEHERLMAIPCFTGLYYVSEESLTGNGELAQRETERVHLQYRWRQY